MSRRVSGYERKAHNFYPTPAWVTEEVCAHLDCASLRVWEPACGDGDMVNVLKQRMPYVYGTDLRWGTDFLKQEAVPVLPRGYEGATINAIITNPPFGRDGPKFIAKALELMHKTRGTVAMLLPIDFDSGKTRRPYFADCPAWHRKLVLHRRILWFESPNGHGPSENHAWYIWNWKRKRAPASIIYQRPETCLVQKPIIIGGTTMAKMTYGAARMTDLLTLRN